MRSKWKNVVRRLSQYEIGDYVSSFSLCREMNNFKEHSQHIVGTYLHTLCEMGYLEKNYEKVTGLFYLLKEYIPSSLPLRDVNAWHHSHIESIQNKDNMRNLFSYFESMDRLQKLKEKHEKFARRRKK
jgi:hypothetical protein